MTSAADREPVDSATQDGMDGLTIADLADIDDDLFDRLFHDVLEQAFPPSELGGLERLRAEYRPPLPESCGSVLLRGGEPLGAALGSHSPGSGVLLLSYLAVRSDLRGRGLGTVLLGHALPRWRERFGAAVTLAEVEDPRCHRASAYGDPVARLRLYDRIGAKLLPLAYFQPALDVGLSRVRGMFLICLDPELDAVPGNVLLHFLEEYITSCEGEEATRGDAEFGALRERILSWPEAVPLWPLSRADDVPRSELEAAAGGVASADPPEGEGRPSVP